MLNKVLAGLLAGLGVAVALTAPMGRSTKAWAADPVLRVGGDRLVEMDLPAEIGTVLIANPAIADVAPVDRQRLAVIAKKPGSTSLVVFSKSGERLLGTTVVVGGDDPWTITVHRGAAESSLNCAPRCTPSGGSPSGASPATLTLPALGKPGS